MYIEIKITVLLLLAVHSHQVQKHVLILGGNGLIGSATVQSIIESKFAYNVTLINRGNWYWDTASLIKPFVRHIQCERGDNFKNSCEIKDDGIFYDTIVDFSCYDPLDIEDVLIVLEGRFRKYIYISSDSVYEVCKEKTHNGYLREDDAVRPENNKLAYLDNYGHKKLEGEETLEKFHEMLNYKYIALRLPDVIGPRDNTNRFWKYYLQSKLNNVTEPIPLSHKIANQKLSFVYSRDVGQLILTILNHPDDQTRVWNQAYNVAFDEVLTLQSFYKTIGNVLKANLSFEYSNEEYESLGFPSVTKGAVDNDKVKVAFQWKPTSFEKAIFETCQFYEAAQFNTAYKFRLDIILDTLGIRGFKYRDFLKMHLQQLEDMRKDEL